MIVSVAVGTKIPEVNGLRQQLESQHHTSRSYLKESGSFERVSGHAQEQLNSLVQQQQDLKAQLTKQSARIDELIL